MSAHFDVNVCATLDIILQGMSSGRKNLPGEKSSVCDACENYLKIRTSKIELLSGIFEEHSLTYLRTLEVDNVSEIGPYDGSYLSLNHYFLLSVD